jgi:peroxiredoxin
MRGQPLLVTFFTTWCLQCQREASEFNQIYRRFGVRGVNLLGIAVDTDVPPPMIQTYVDFVGFRFDVVRVQPDNLDLITAFGPTKLVPRTLLLNAKRQIIIDQKGSTRFAEVRAELEKLLPRLSR